MNEYGIKLKADRSGFTGEMKAATGEVDEINNALLDLVNSAKRVAEGLRQTSNEINQAAAATKGARQDVGALTDDMEQLQVAAGGIGNAARASAAGIHTHYVELDRAGVNTRNLTRETTSLHQQFISLRGVLATLGIYALGREVKDTLAEFQDTRTMIQGLTRDQREYAETQRYLVGVADDYSANLNVLSESYARLLSLQKAEIITTQESRSLLEGLLDAKAELKVSNEQLGLVYYGLAQGLSQVNLQAQELNQVVEPLPGLLTHMSTAAGQNFRAMVMEGEATSDLFKTTLVEALGAYEGAAERTRENLSAIQNRIATQHQLLVASLEQPIDNTIGAVFSGYEVGLKAVNSNLPTLIELLKDTSTVVGALVGIRVAQYLYGAAAASSVFNAAMYGMSTRMAAQIVLTNSWTATLGRARAALLFLGGPVGAAVLAGTAIYAFSARSDEAARRTETLTNMVNGLADSFESLTVEALDAQLAEAQQSLQAVQSVIENLQAPVAPQGFDALVTTGQAELMEEYKRKLTDYGQLQQYWTQAIEQLTAARSEAEARAAQESAAATAELTARQQELLDKYLPLQKLTREYQTELATLNGIETVSTEEAARKAEAIEVLTAVYEQERKEILGLTAAEDAAAKVREKTLQQMMTLIDAHAPLQNAQSVYLEQLTLLTQARDEGHLSLENYHIAVASVANAHYEALNPGAEIIEQLRQERIALGLTGIELEYYNRTRNLSTEQIEEHGDAIRALIVDIHNEQTALDATSESQRVYQQRTESMLDDLQRSWADYLKQIYRDHDFTLRSMADTALDIWFDTIARMQSQSLAEAFAGALPNSSGVLGSGGTGASGINLGQMASVIGAGVSNVLGASMVQNSAPIYEGGKLISEGASSLNFSLKNLGSNMIAGYAGGQIGTKLGESIFGKEAQSGWGATAGAVLGSFIPGVGTFLGALAGGALDAMFGGDGYERSSVGFDTGRDSVDSDYYTGSRELAGDLVVNTINRRGDDAITDQIVDKAAEIAAYIAGSAAGIGGKLNAAGMQLSGVGGDYGDSTGSFVGMRSGDGQDSEAALDAMFASFSVQLINHIEGLDEDVRAAMMGVAGTADEVLKKFDETVKVNTLVKSGALDAFGDKVDFAFGQSLVDAAGSIEALTAATTAWNNNVAESVQFQEDTVNRLREAVGAQFGEMGLVLSEYSSVTEFREEFETLRATMDATDILKFIQAGNALALLIDQEEQLTQVRIAGMSEQLATAEGLYDQYQAIRSSAIALTGTIANDIYKIRGVNVADLRASLNTGSYDEQVEAVNRLREYILDQYNEELQASQQLHQETLKQYETQHQAARSIGEYLQSVLASDLSPLSIADRLGEAQSHFDDIVQRALAGDTDAAQQAQSAFEQFARLNQTANASSAGGVTAFYAALEKLQAVQAYLDQVQEPGAAPTVNSASTINQLVELQGELNRIQSDNAVELVTGLGALQLLLEQLPTNIALALAGSLPGPLASALQIGANLGLLSNDVRGALGLLPQKPDLTSFGIAQQIEALTLLSQHPSLMAENFGDLSSIMGAMMLQLVQNGASTHMLADMIAKIPTAAAGANQYLQQNNLGSLTDYQSAVNTQYSNQDINDYVQSIITQAANEEAAVRAVMAAALAGGVGSGQLAASTGYSQEDILALAAKYGYASFDVGTDRVTRDQFARIHQEEIIFNPVESGTMRKAIVERVTSGADPEAMARLLKAVEAQSRLLEQLVAGIESVSGQQQSAFANSSREIRDSVDRLTREIEEWAA